MSLIHRVDAGRFHPRPESRLGEKASCMCVILTIATLGVVIATAVKKQKDWTTAIALGATAGANLLLAISCNSCCEVRYPHHAADDDYQAMHPSTRRHHSGPIEPVGKLHTDISEIALRVPGCRCRVLIYTENQLSLPEGWAWEDFWADNADCRGWARLTDAVRAAHQRGDSVLVKSCEPFKPFLHVREVSTGISSLNTRLAADWENQRPVNFVAMEQMIVVIVPAAAAAIAPIRD
jgi:hypothetical protein